ncbi:MAG TPA: hypothetical protein VN414_09170, partial [Methanosarcina sp.]|nr:hypothetical protein [Methanosarcina sp.]
ILFIGLKENSNSSQAEDGLKIVAATEVLGSIDSANNTSIQSFTYDFVLYNKENEEIHLDSVEPIFTKDLLARVLTENHEIIGNKTISPNSTICVKGQVEFNASGLSKEQILNLDHIYSINITSTKTLLFPKGGS